jgi:citrate lyase synthetase
MKLYADYIKEREDKECIWNDNCFITYKIYGNEVSVLDIYSSSEARGTGEMLEFVKDFYTNMYERGIKTAYGYTDEDTNGWENSERLMLKFGFKKIGKNENYNNYVLNIEEIL